MRKKEKESKMDKAANKWRSISPTLLKIVDYV